jgi:short-subunit dehydrogenase
MSLPSFSNLLRSTPPTDWKDKVIVVTGGTDGIGKALVEQFLQLGARVATCGRNADKLYQLQIQHPDSSLLTLTADVSKENDCRLFIERTISSFGRIDALVNNAGISMRAMFEDVDLDVIRQVMDINFYGSVYCTKYALPSLLKTNGTVVGISSIAGYRGLPGRSGYSASKFALQGWMEALRTELLDQVHVMWVCPGFTASNIRQVALNKEGQQQGETPMDESKMMSADTCAQHIIQSMGQKKRTLVLTFTGKRAVFMNKFFPAWTDRLTHRFFFKNGELIK